METLPELWRRSSQRQPRRDAFVAGDRRLTYERADERIESLAERLGELGAGAGTKVCLFFSGGPDFAVALLATVRAGAVACPMNPALNSRELEQLTTLLEPDLAFHGLAGAEIISEVERQLPTAEYDDGLLRGDVAPLPRRPAEEELDGVACILCTSGTTGLPKAGMLTHSNLISNVESLAANKRWSEPEVFGNSLPAFHVYGITVLTLLPIYLGGTVVFIPRFTPENCLKAIESEGITRFGGVPSMFTLLNRYTGRDKLDSSSCRSWISGGAPLPRPVADEFENKFGGKIYEGYGMLETSPGISWNLDDGEFHPGAVGRPMRDVEVRILDDESGRELPQGEIGEIVVRSPGVMKGYYRDPAATAETIRDGWLYTGDTGCFDEDGYLSLKGRTKELIIVGANNVYPREIEAVLLEEPVVADAAVAARQDPVRGEQIYAFVVLESGAELDARALKLRCRDALAAFKVPRRIHQVDEIPRNPSGKILRSQLIDGLE